MHVCSRPPSTVYQRIGDPSGHPHQSWLQTIKEDLKTQNIGLSSAWHIADIKLRKQLRGRCHLIAGSCYPACIRNSIPHRPHTQLLAAPRLNFTTTPILVQLFGREKNTIAKSVRNMPSTDYFNIISILTS